MNLALTDQQQADQQSFRQFVDARIVPYADQFDREERTPAELIRAIADQGYLGAAIPQALGGTGSDMVTFGLLNEELGRGCSSIRSLLTVHSMLTHVISKRGNKYQRATWLPQLIAGELIGAFGLTEPDVGSDAKSVTTSARPSGDRFILNGRKKWTTFGQIADLFLIFAQVEGRPTAFVVERDRPGFTTTPISGMLGTKASMLAELTLEDCDIPRENMIGGIGFGLATIATAALDIGRYSVAWGCVGILQACLEASIAYTRERQQFGVYLKDHQLIRQMITNMVTNAKAARLLCLQAGVLKDAGDPRTITETWVAKYFASLAASQAASDAVQIHGANGCSADYPVQRYFRDSKIMEIIEGSTQIQQITIADQAYQSQEALW